MWNGTAHAAEVTIAVTLRRWLADTGFEKGSALPATARHNLNGPLREGQGTGRPEASPEGRKRANGQASRGRRGRTA